MPGTYKDKKRNELLNENEETLFKLAMLEYAEAQGQELLALQESLPDDEYGVTPQAKRKFNQEIKRAFARKRLYQLKPSRWAAILIIAIILTFTTLNITVEAVRVRSFRFISDVQDAFTSLRFSDHMQNSIVDERLSGGYAPTYVPEGYEIAELNDLFDKRVIIYEGNVDGIVMFSFEPLEGVMNIDTEDALVEPIDIKGYDGLLVIKGERVMIIWASAENVFTLASFLPVEEAIRMAESTDYHE